MASTGWRAMWLLGALLGTLSGCDGGSDGAEAACTPTCAPALCESCIDGACRSACDASETCVAGTCRAVDPAGCAVACDATRCEVCVDGACQSTCAGGLECRDGACALPGGCSPPCQPLECQSCVDGQCLVACDPDESCNAGLCEPGGCTGCDATLCQLCGDGQCASACTDGQVCEDGACVASGACTPACSAAACETCEAGRCVSTCGAGESCVAGACALSGACTPACDTTRCQACRAGACVTACAAGESCVGGRCEGGPTGLTVRDIQDESRPGHPAVDSAVTLAGVVVTAIDTNGTGAGSFWVQDPAGGRYSGVYVYNQPRIDVTALAVGVRIDVAGTYKEFNGVTELVLVSIESVGAAGTAPAPERIADPLSIATGGADAEAYEGVLVEVTGVACTNVNPDAPQTFGEFEVAGGLRVDDDLYHHEVTDGESFPSVTGVLHFSFDNSKLLPRSADDLR